MNSKNESEDVAGFLKECDDFSVWVESACAEELEMFAKSDGYFRATLDMLEKRRANQEYLRKKEEYLRAETRRIAASTTVPDLMLDHETSTKIVESLDSVTEMLTKATELEADHAAELAEDQLINELLKSLESTNNDRPYPT